MLEASQILGPAELYNVEAAQRSRVAAARALDFEGRLESNEIGSRADVLRGHPRRVTHEEQDRNKEACGNRAKRPRIRVQAPPITPGRHPLRRQGI